MAQAKKTTTRAKTAKPATTAKPAPEAAAFTLANTEMPEAFRDLADKSVVEIKDAYEKIRTATEDATDVIEETLDTGRQGIVEFNLKALENAKTSTDAVFTFLRDFYTVKSVAEAVELQSTFARQQYELMASQGKDLQEFGVELANGITKPAKEAVNKTVKDLKAA